MYGTVVCWSLFIVAWILQHWVLEPSNVLPEYITVFGNFASKVDISSLAVSCYENSNMIRVITPIIFYGSFAVG